MEARDYQITARIRHLLHRRAVDSSSLEFGSVDGVAYLRGPIRRLPGAADAGRAASKIGSLLGRLEEDLRRIEGVHSIVLDVRGYKKVKGEWKRQAVTETGGFSSSSM
jgi:hypothetical protein